VHESRESPCGVDDLPRGTRRHLLSGDGEARSDAREYVRIGIRTCERASERANGRTATAILKQQPSGVRGTRDEVIIEPNREKGISW